MLDQLDANFRFLSYPELIMKVGTIADLLTNHPGYPLPWPDVVPDPEQLKAQVASLTNSVNAAAHGDREKIAERNSTRSQLELSAAITAQYLIMKSIKEKDPSRLHNTGFALKTRTKSTGSSNLPIGVPRDLTAKHGPVSGMLIVKAHREPGAATYELHMCQGDPTGEESWQNMGLFVHCSRIELKDLEVPKKYTFRMRCHGVNGPSSWSSNVSQIVI